MPKYRIEAVGIYGYVLVLNPMMSNTESGKQFGPFDTMDDLKAFYFKEVVEPYSDEGPDVFNGGTKPYRKFFRKDGPLEWMNPVGLFWKPPEQLTGEDWEPNHFNHGVHEILVGVEAAQKLHLIG